MSLEKLEQAFGILDKTVTLLQVSLDIPFLEAYAENVENILDDYQVRVLDGEPSAEVVQQLTEAYQILKALALTPEEWRKAAQLVLLKGNQREPLQANHQLTPDGIGFLFVFLIQELYQKGDLHVLDLTVGMGNLLLTILLNLQLAGRQAVGTGVDIDEMLLAVAAANTELTRASVSYFHQDGLQDLLLEPVDVAVADLPVGYYPNDERAQTFNGRAPEGHSYAHHLLLEQSMKYVKPGGFGLFLLPSNFMESDQSSYLKAFLRTEVYVQGVIQLPEELFRSAGSQKSIVLLQRHGGKAKQVKEVLLAQLGSLKNTESMTEFLTKFEDWKSLNL